MARLHSLIDAQLPLRPQRAGVYDENAEEMRKLLNEALRANGVSQEQLAHVTNKDPSHLSRMLGGKGAHPSLDVIAAIMGLDAKRVVLTGLNGMCGCKPPEEERPDPAEEARELRATLTAVLDALSKAVKK
jgi:transcriptional regulator with XRE-family HTH domain